MTISFENSYGTTSEGDADTNASLKTQGGGNSTVSDSEEQRVVTEYGVLPLEEAREWDHEK